MLNLKWTMSAVMLAGAFAGTVSQASAQSQNYRGTFELPFEARVGKVVLQPGTYTVSALEGAKGLRIMGEKGKVSILSAGDEIKPIAEKAKMVFVDSDGMYTLESFESKSMGKALHFHVAKSPREAGERAAVRTAVEVGLQ